MKLSVSAVILVFKLVAAQPEYDVIRGEDPYDSFCWTIKGRKAVERAKIILDDCNEKDDAQLFRQLESHEIGLGECDGCSCYVEIRPKLNDNLVVGVRELKNHAWLRLERPQETKKESHSFYFDEHGKGGTGNFDECEFELYFDEDTGEPNIPSDCLIITTQGLKVSKGKPVLLKTLEEIKHFEDHDANIIWWWFI